MTIEILPDAQRDLISGFRFYEQQAPGLGRYFLDCLFADIELLGVHGGIHALVFGYHRRGRKGVSARISTFLQHWKSRKEQSKREQEGGVDDSRHPDGLEQPAVAFAGLAADFSHL